MQSCLAAADRALPDLLTYAKQYHGMSEIEAQLVSQIWTHEKGNYIRFMIGRHVGRAITTQDITYDMQQHFLPKARNIAMSMMQQQRPQQMMIGYGQNTMFGAPGAGYGVQQPMGFQQLAQCDWSTMDPWGGGGQRQQIAPQQQQVAQQQAPVANNTVVASNGAIPAQQAPPSYVDPTPIEDGIFVEDPNGRFKVSSTLYQAGEELVNCIAITCTDIRYSCIDEIRSAVMSIPACLRGHHKFITYSFVSPIVVPIAKEKFLEISRTIRRNMEDVTKRDSKLGCLPVVLSALENEKRGPADAFDRFLTQRFNRYISYGRLTDKEHLALSLQVENLNGIIKLGDESTQDETIKKLHSVVFNFNQALNDACVDQFQHTFRTLDQLVISPKEFVECLLYSKLLPRFIEKADGSFVPTQDLAALYLKKRELSSTGTSTEGAQNAKLEFDNAVKRFESEYTVYLEQKVTVETDLPAYSMFKLKENGSLVPTILQKQPFNLSFFVIQLFGEKSPIAKTHKNVSIDLIVHDRAIDWKAGLGITADSRAWYGTV